MPEIDLATVIFAIVALFVAFKLRSVLGMRSDDKPPTPGLGAPLRRAPAPGPCAADRAHPAVAGRRALSGALEGRRRARGLAGARRRRDGRPDLQCSRFPGRRENGL